MNKILSASTLILLLCMSFATIFTLRQVDATMTNTIFTTQAQVYSAFDSLVNNQTIWKQTFGLSDQGNTTKAYWIRHNITVACDINHDGKVSLADLVMLALAYGSSPTNSLKSKWNPSADIDCNGIIGLSDLVCLANNYGTGICRDNDPYPNASIPSKVVMLDGCLHGYESESATLLYNLALFLSNSSNARASNITNSVQFFIVPIINYDRFGTMYGARPDANNVNLNRNFPYNWGVGATWYDNPENSSQYNATGCGSTNPNDPNGDYIGPSVASENETQELITAFATVRPNTYISLHVGGGKDVNPNGTYIETQWDYESLSDNATSTNLWKNYTAVSSAYNMTNQYSNTYPQNLSGSSTCDFGYYYHVPSVTLEIWKYGVNMTHPSSDGLNGTMLNEIQCFIEGDKNFLTGQQAQGMMMQLLDDSGTSVYVDPAYTSACQGASIDINITISNASDLAGWQFGLYWDNSKLNCTNATLYDPSCWNGSLSCDQQLNNTYNATAGYFFNAQAMEDGDIFNGTVTVATLTFYVLGWNTNTTLSLNNVVLSDSVGNEISPSTTNGIIHILKIRPQIRH